jgi:hypothetical protein
MRESMEIYPITAAGRAMKLQEVLLRATAGKIKWWQAAELMGISDRQMRWHDLIVILDDATSEIYYAQPAREETTAAVMAGLRAVIETEGAVLFAVF